MGTPARGPEAQPPWRPRGPRPRGTPGSPRRARARASCSRVMPGRSSGPPRRARRHRARARKRSSLAFVARLGSRGETRRGGAARAVSSLRASPRARRRGRRARAPPSREPRARTCASRLRCATTENRLDETAARDWPGRRVQDSSVLMFRVDREKGWRRGSTPMKRTARSTDSRDELFGSDGIVGRPEKGARVVRPRGALYRGDGRDEVTDQRHGVADADARVFGDAEGPHRRRDDGTLPHAWTSPFPPALRRNRALWRHLHAPPRTRERLTRACVAFPERER